MPEWAIALLSALAALILREAYEWFKRPRLVLDFERRDEEYPYVPDYNNETMQAVDITYRIKYLRLRVHNRGKSTANDCEAKLELIVPIRQSYYVKSLHWSKRDPRIYKNLDQIYAPINLNKNDEETVDILQLQYSYSSSDPEPICGLNIETVSPSGLLLYPSEDYYIKVTIFARNTTSMPFYFKVNWNGTVQGFHKALTKLNGFPKRSVHIK